MISPSVVAALLETRTAADEVTVDADSSDDDDDDDDDYDDDINGDKEWQSEGCDVAEINTTSLLTTRQVLLIILHHFSS